MKRILIEILREIYMWYIAALNYGFTYLPYNFMRVAVLKYLYFVKIGPGTTMGIGVKYKKPMGMTIGRNTNINPGVRLDNRGGFTVGDNVDIGEGVVFYCGSHDINDPYYRTKVDPTVIHDRVCIFAGSMIVRGITIGEGAVVAAMSMVRKDIEPYAIVGGNPAKVIGERSHDLRYELNSRSLRRTWQEARVDNDAEGA
ncbi:MAG: acyltransferase [Candidatus Hydrogenedens sp.]|nr:acyltransferase [Candidatus Hydrogenedens sp.]